MVNNIYRAKTNESKHTQRIKLNYFKWCKNSVCCCFVSRKTRLEYKFFKETGIERLEKELDVVHLIKKLFETSAVLKKYHTHKERSKIRSTKDFVLDL